MPIEFPLAEIPTPFGLLLNPTLTLVVKSRRGDFLFRFLVDSGADVSMMPRSAADTLGVDLAGCRRMEAGGIEGGGVPGWGDQIRLQVGDLEISIPCFFSSREDTPYLLGRAGFFQHFNVTFDNRRKMIVLDPIKR